MTTRADRERQRALGKKGGRSTSPAKVAAARRNVALARFARLLKKTRAATEVTVTTPCYAGCSLERWHDGPCFVPAKG